MKITSGFLKNIRSCISKELQAKSGDEPYVVLIYTMGKVGSSTIKATLQKELNGMPVFHVHFLSDEWINRNHDVAWLQKNIDNANYIKNFLKRNSHLKIKIISMVREPIIRDLSNIFQNPHLFFQETSIENMKFEGFFSKIPILSHDYTLNWFDDEFKSYLGFNVYNHPFDKNLGYSRYKHNQYDILLIKLEKLNQCYKSALKEFLDLDVEHIINENTSADKGTKEFYLKLKKVYKEPYSFLEKTYSSAYVKHFYSDEEINVFIKRWKEASHSN